MVEVEPWFIATVGVPRAGAVGGWQYETEPQLVQNVVLIHCPHYCAGTKVNGMNHHKKRDVVIFWATWEKWQELRSFLQRFCNFNSFFKSFYPSLRILRAGAQIQF